MRHRLARLRRLLDRLGPLLALIVMCVGLSIANRHFSSPENIIMILSQIACVSVLAVGETMVIIAGAIDLSVGSVLALCGVTAALLMTHGANIWLVMVAALAFGGFCGLISGLLSTYGRLPSFIATLGMMGMARGFALILTGGLNVFGLPPQFKSFASTSIAGIPLLVVIAAVVAIIAHIVLSRMAFGRAAYAIGGNAEAARLSGIPVNRAVTAHFVIAGFLSALAGLVLVMRLRESAPPTAGQGYELDAIAASVIGGASLMGGQGGIPGTMVGAAIMGVLRNGCDLMGVSPFWQQVAIGAIIIAAVFYDRLRRR